MFRGSFCAIALTLLLAFVSCRPIHAEVTTKPLKEYADVWGKLPERERAKATTELTRGMPAKYRDAIQAYFKQLEKSGAK